MPHRTLLALTLTLALGLLHACSNENPTVKPPSKMPDEVTDNTAKSKPAPKTVTDQDNDKTASPTLATATFGAGCFWCIEAVLEQLDGVKSVESGYMGGQVKNPTYEQICTGLTGHAEVVEVKFDSAKISYKTLLKWFFKLHDPTTLNRQENDVGTQYRSAIFYNSEEQKTAAVRAKKLIDEGKVFADPVVTEVTKASTFYPAERYHQDYYRQNKSQPYCRAIITPKLDKLGLDK